jgi:hypothetical protein
MEERYVDLLNLLYMFCSLVLIGVAGLMKDINFESTSELTHIVGAIGLSLGFLSLSLYIKKVFWARSIFFIMIVIYFILWFVDFTRIYRFLVELATVQQCDAVLSQKVFRDFQCDCTCNRNGYNGRCQPDVGPYCLNTLAAVSTMRGGMKLVSSVLIILFISGGATFYNWLFRSSSEGMMQKMNYFSSLVVNDAQTLSRED